MNDDLTDEDMAAGFQQFADAYNAGYVAALRLLHEDTQKLLSLVGYEPAKELIKSALAMVDLDMLASEEPDHILMTDPIDFTSDDIFAEWRKIHPRR